ADQSDFESHSHYQFPLVPAPRLGCQAASRPCRRFAGSTLRASRARPCGRLARFQVGARVRSARLHFGGGGERGGPWPSRQRNTVGSRTIRAARLAQGKELPVPLRARVAPRLRFGWLAGGAERGSSTKREGRLSGRPEL